MLEIGEFIIIPLSDYNNYYYSMCMETHGLTTYGAHEIVKNILSSETPTPLTNDWFLELN